MSTYSAGDQVNRAMRLIGMLAEGETPSASASNDCLVAMNQMIDSWNTENLSTFATQEQVFTWTAGNVSQTIGPSGDFVGNRPILLLDSTYFRDPGTNVSFSVQMINQEQYNGIAVKTVTSTYPQVLWINVGFPNDTLTAYPVASRDLEWHFVSATELTQPADLSTTLAFPPGYLRAFTFNLAMEIAAEFGVEPSPQVTRIAMTSKRNLKRINNPQDVMSMPYAIMAQRQRFNVYSGNY